MIAGLHLKVDIIGIVNLTDDTIGGARTTGTVRYADIQGVLTPRRPSQAALEAGLETDAIYDFTTRAQNVTLNERDEIEVTWPPTSALYGLRFRVTGVQPGRGRARYAPLHATTSRIRASRSSQ